MSELSIAVRQCQCGGAMVEVVEDSSPNGPIRCGELGCGTIIRSCLTENLQAVQRAIGMRPTGENT